MKSTNFIDTIPMCQEKEVQRWLIMSLICIALTIGTLSCIEIRQINQYHSLCISCQCCAKTDADHSQLQKKMEELQTKEKELQEKLAQFSKQKEIAQQTIARLICLGKCCGSDCHLESYSANAQDLQMTIAGSSSEHLSRLITSMSASRAFNGLILTSMQPKEKGFLFTIKDRY